MYYMEEAIIVILYCTYLDPASRERDQQLVNNYVRLDPYLIKMNEFRQDLKVC